MWGNIVSVIFLLFSSTSIPKQEIRQRFAQSVESKKSAQALIVSLEKMDQSPFVSGYCGATKMVMAKHVLNPFSKLNYFNQGKKMLNQAIEKDRSNVELVFLRYASQVKAPKVLNYNEHIDADKKQIVSTILTNSRQVDKTLLKNIVMFMKTQEISTDERTKLINLL